MDKIEILEKIATRLRIHSVKMTTKAGSGHPTTCLSMADLTACLFFDEMKYDPKNPDNWSNDELVLCTHELDRVTPDLLYQIY